MQELIEVKNGTAILRADIASKIAEFERTVKSIEEQEKALKSMILAEMEDKGLLWIDTDDLHISYVAPCFRERFDIKTFKAENPLIYDVYVTMSHVRSSVRVKVKDNE